jgi:hypothetical protein
MRRLDSLELCVETFGVFDERVAEAPQPLVYREEVDALLDIS